MASCLNETLEEGLERWCGWFNSTLWENRDGGPDCAVCGNKRILAFVKEGYRTVRECACAGLLKNEEQLRKSGMYELVLRCGFENFQTGQRWQQALCEKVRACLDTDRWLLLCGQSGSGKTHLAAAFCRCLLDRGQQVQFMSWPQESHRLQAAWFDYERREALMEPFVSAPVLLVDDLFKTTRDEKGLPQVPRQEQDAAFELMERRYRAKLRTVITTEVLTGPLRALNEGLFGRVKERTGPFVVDIPYDKARDHRLQAQ